MSLLLLLAPPPSGLPPADPVRVGVATPTTTTGATNTTTTGNLASTAVGDLNILVLNVVPAANLTDPGVPTIGGVSIAAAGWTDLTLGSWDSGSPGPRLTVVGRVYQSGDPTSITWGWASPGDSSAGGIAYQAGTFDPADPITNEAIQVQASSSTNFPLPSMTTTTRGTPVEIASNRTSGTWTMPHTTLTSAYAPSSANFAISDAGPQAAGTFTPTATFSAATSVGNTAQLLVNAFPGSSGLTAALAPVAEVDTAIALGRTKTRPLTPAAGTDTATTLTRGKNRTLTPAPDTGAAVPLLRAKTRPLTPTGDTSTTVALLRAKSRVLTSAGDTATAVAVSRAKSRALTPAGDVATAVALLRVIVETGTRPNLGTTGRPSSGTTTRPTGITTRPDAGVTLRPDTGTTIR